MPRLHLVFAAGLALAATSTHATTVVYVDSPIPVTAPLTTTLVDSINLSIVSGSAIQSGAIDGNGSITKIGDGMLTLSGANTFSGGVAINTGTLGGHGTVGAVAIHGGGAISPGDSPGTLTTGAETWAGDGSYVWQINNATGTQGTNWDFLDINGSLALDNTSSSPFTIHVTSLDLVNASDFATNFVRGNIYTFTIATATSPIANFSADKFLIDTSTFLNDPTNKGNFAIVRSADGKSLELTYTGVPEPSAYAVGIAGILGAMILLRRRRQK